MTIRETCFPLFFYLALVIHPADRHFERSEKSFSSPFSHDSFTKPFTGSTVPPFLRYGVSHSLLSDTRRLTANEKDPSASLGMTIRETCFPLFFYLALVIHPADCHFERSEKSFSSPFSHDSFAKPFRGSTVPAFPAIRCFPFLAVEHAPFYRQRKRSLDSARDDDTGNVLSQHNLFPIYGNAHFPPFY